MEKIKVTLKQAQDMLRGLSNWMLKKFITRWIKEGYIKDE